MITRQQKKWLHCIRIYVLVLFRQLNNRFPRSNQSMTNKTFIGEFVALAFVFAAGYAFMIVA